MHSIIYTCDHVKHFMIVHAYLCTLPGAAKQRVQMLYRHQLNNVKNYFRITAVVDNKSDPLQLT